MKTLNLHCDKIAFKANKKALKNIDEIVPGQEMSGEVNDCLAVLLAVEKEDNDETIQKAVADIKSICEQVKTKSVVLYPYAHLSSNLAKPEKAVEIMNKIAKNFGDFKLTRAPFGYYKEFEVKVKGHPLSELSREFKVQGNEEDLSFSEKDREVLLKKMTKIKMSAPLGKNNLKSNVELGRELDLYMVSEVIGQGLPLLTAKGTAIKREIERFIVDEELKRGYEHTSTPVMAKSDLYKLSGHWQHYKEDMFTLNVHGDDFALRPMTCPFHFALFKRKPRSYKDLPKRYAEIASLFRNEQSGELRGLTRVRQFTLADAHIICTPDQLEKEFLGVVDLINFVMKTLNIEVWYRFSRWDPKNKRGKYLDNKKAWEESESAMKNILDKLEINYVEAKDEAAFYGPKLDLQFKDVYGKEDTLITIQIDFANCSNFNLTYLDKDGKEKPTLVIHRSSTGATERVISYLLEKTQGNLPLWLSPVQVKVLSMNDDLVDYAKEINTRLISEGIRSEVDITNESISKKARNAITNKVFYLATVGQKEKENNKVALRKRDAKEISEVSIEELIEKIKSDIKSKN